MEIEFNPSRVGNARAAQPAAKGRVAAAAGDSTSLAGADALKQAINDISLVRPDKVDAARAAVSDTTFPPDEVLRAIATLIAQKM